MTYLILAVALVAVGAVLSLRRVGAEEQIVVQRFGKARRTIGAGLAFVVPVLERVRRVDTSARHRWTVTTTRTMDGASAHLRVEYVFRVTDAALAPELVEEAVKDAVDARLRKHVAERSVQGLPVVGQVMAWAADSFLPGVLVESAEVTVRNVEMIGDLRRLLDDQHEH